MPLSRRASSLMVLVTLIAGLAACTATDPRLEDEATPAPTLAPTGAPAATPTVPAASATVIGSAHVVMLIVLALRNRVFFRRGVRNARRRVIGRGRQARGREHHPDDSPPDMGRRAVRQRQQAPDRLGPASARRRSAGVPWRRDRHRPRSRSRVRDADHGIRTRDLPSGRSRHVVPAIRRPDIPAGAPQPKEVLG